MSKLRVSLAAGMVALCLKSAALAQTVAFPGALGFGSYATGGRNGTVYHVTTLADSGAGSFRDAVSHSGRTIVFDVGGTITLSSAVSCSGSLTIAGQTAPGGIVFNGGEISFAGRSNIICRYIRIRPGSATSSSTDDALSFYQASNLIVDHSSIAFAPWNNLDGVGDSTHVVTAITLQNCINANPTGQQFGAHTESVGGQWSWFYNLFANSHNRNPLSKVNDVFINNLEYNCSAGYTTHTSTHFQHDIVNNYFIAGPASGGNFPWYQIDKNQSIYYSGDLYDGDKDGTVNGSFTIPYWYQGPGTVLTSPWSSWTTVVPAMSADMALRYDLSTSGAFPRDEVDSLIISQVKTYGNGPVGTVTGTAGPDGNLYTSQAQTGLSNNGYGTLNGLVAATDTDGDGMPDYWELATGSATNTANALTNTITGYTLLENYLNFLAAPHAVTRTNTPVDINLSQFTSGFSAVATFALTNSTNGTVTLLNSTNAHFVPNANFSGLGTFNFTVTDGSLSLSVTVTVCVTPIPPPASATQFFGALVGATLAAAPLPSNLIWRGDGTANLWDTTSSNWFNGSSSAAFKNNDAVTLNDTGSYSPALNLVSTVSPNSFSFDSTNTFTISGNGKLSGSMALTKAGTGSLILATTNSFSGPVSTTGGTLELDTTTAAGSGTITLNGGTLSLKAPGGPATYINPVVVASPSTVFVPGSGNSNQRLSGAISGSEVLNVSANNGTLSVAGSMSSFSGSVVMVNSGTFRWYGSTGSGSASFDLGNGSATMLVRDGGTAVLGSLTGGANTFLKGASSSAIATTYLIGGNNLSTTYAGQVNNGTVVGNPTSVSNPTNSTAILKTGSGTFTLTGTSYHSGSTSVTNGTLLVNGSFSGTSPITASGNGTLAGTGYLGGLVTINGGGKLNPGNGGAGTVTLGGGLTLNGGAVNVDLANVVTIGGVVNDLISLNGGALTLNGTTAINPNFLNGAPGNGTYTLISGGASTSGSTANLSWGGPSTTRQSFALNTDNPGALQLNVSGPSAASLVWLGTNGLNWDNSTPNWANAGQTDVFYNLDSVLFDDSGANASSVMLATSLWPASILVNSSQNYVFGGPGSLIGTGGLTKSGSGTLTIGNLNSAYSGNFYLTGGTLAAAPGSSLGLGTVIISGGAMFSLLAGSPSVFFGGQVLVPANQTGNISSGQLGNGVSGSLLSGGTNSVLFLNNGVSFGATNSSQFDGFNGTINIPAGASLRYSANFSGKNFGSFNTSLVINGSLQPRNAGNTVQLGAFTGSGIIAGPQSNAGAGDTLYVIGGNNTDATFSGVISSNSAVAGSDVIVSKIGGGRLTLSGSSTYAGGTTVNAGTLRVNNLTGSGTGTGDVEIFSGAVLTGKGIIGSSTTIDDGATLSPGDPNGTLSFTNNLTLNGNCVLQFGLGTNGDSVVVGGDLFLTGQLYITNSGGFGIGVYPLFTCAGALILDNLVLASAPSGYHYSFNTNTPGVVKLIVAPTTPPGFGSVSLMGDALSFNGSNGVPLAGFYVLTSTNLSAPLGTWTRLATNQFDSVGNFNFTTSFNTNLAQGFYGLQVQ